MSYNPKTDEFCMEISIGYVMTADECEKLMKRAGATWADYETEEEAYMDMAEFKFSEGMGINVTPCEDYDPHYVE